MLRAPVHVHWEITAKCNLSCLHCYQQDDPRPRPHDLPVEHQLRIANRVIGSGALQVTVTGGEPFLNRHLRSIVLHFADWGLRPLIATNGAVPLGEHLDWLREAAHVQVSLDSHDPRVHDRLRRRPGAHSQAVKSMKALSAAHVPFGVAFCATTLNYRDVGEALGLAASLGAQSFSAGEGLILYGPTDVQDGLRLSPSQLRAFILVALDAMDRYAGNSMRVQINSEWGFLISRRVDQVPCTGFDRDMAILHDGSVSPCPFIRKGRFRHGSLVTDSLLQLWNGDRAEEFRRHKLLGCSEACSAFAVCGSGCKAQLANQGKPIGQRSPFCPIGTFTKGEPGDSGRTE